MQATISVARPMQITIIIGGMAILSDWFNPHRAIPILMDVPL